MSSNIKFNFPLAIILISLAITLCSEKSKPKFRSLKPNPFLNATTKDSNKLKLHSKLLQTVYSDSFSKNFYYTTLYLGDQKVRQTYIIDTGSSIMSSPCAPCAECGAHKRPFYYDMNHNHKPLECSSRICKLLPANVCQNKDLKFLKGKSCSFNVDRNRDGIKGYYLRDIVYFETDRHLNLSLLKKKVFRSYALPVGCTTAESGKYKELNTDGILGMSNSEKAVPNLLHSLGIINRNLFTLCFGLRGGYMSLGEIDTTYHKSDVINKVPLLESDIYYFVKLNSLRVAGSETSAMKIPLVAKIDTGNSISYFPSITFKSIIAQFKHFCHSGNHTCGNFTYEEDYGYCASFPDRESLFNAIYKNWPEITLTFGDAEYIWKPINYYYYQFNINSRKACLGFQMHKSERIILGSNFIHGHDIIFNRAEKTLGFVESDCSRGNIIWNRFQTMMGNNVFETTDPIRMDKELHHSESENKFHLGDNNNAETITFIQGHNTELDRKEFSMINFVILLVSIIIVAIVIIIVLVVLLCGKKNLKYEKQENEYTPDDQPEEVANNSGDNESGENKISFEENNNNIENLNKEEKDDDDEDKKE
jgi:hypothetical protein